MSTQPETRVLTDALLDAIGDGRVTAAVFVTFQLQPAFFEDHVLAPLLGVGAAGHERVRRVLLDERLRDLDVVVFFDRVGLEPDGSLRQDVRAIPVSRRSGVLHAKHALLLVEHGAGDERREELVLLTTSANLTQAGWWTNVEAADIQRLERGARTPLAEDVRTLLEDLRALDASGADHRALGQLKDFAKTLVPVASGLPRLWLGREPLHEFLGRHLPRNGSRMELIAPFVDERAAPVRQLFDVLAPRQLLVWAPRDREDLPAAGEEWLQGVRDCGARFGELAIDRSMGRRKDAALRYVHAKVIRLTDSDSKTAWLLVGSPNLSVRGHGGGFTPGASANLETALLCEVPVGPDWLIATDGTPPAAVTPPTPDDDPARGRPLPLRLRYDWGREVLEGRTDDAAPLEQVHLAGPKDGETAVLDLPGGAEWVELPGSAAAVIEALFQFGNVVMAWQPGGTPAPLLVEETGLLHRPSPFLKNLTHEDILRHWALFSEKLAHDHLEEVLGRGRAGDPHMLHSRDRRHDEDGRPTLFSRFAGIFHAFIVLRERIDGAIESRRTGQVVTWLLGQRHDSLPTLLDKVRESDLEPTQRLALLLAARELWQYARGRAPELFEEHAEAAAKLDQRLESIRFQWRMLDVDEDFRNWYEAHWEAAP